MSILAKLFQRKLKVKHWWREQGEANQYRIMVDVVHSPGVAETKWVGVIQLNGEMHTSAQAAAMQRICRGLDG